MNPSPAQARGGNIALGIGAREHSGVPFGVVLLLACAVLALIIMA